MTLGSSIKKLFFLLLAWINSALAQNDYGFTYQNEAINPACIAMFNSSFADFPYIRSINLNVCQHSNAAFQKAFQTGDGWHYFYNNNKDLKEGQYRYKVVGKTTNGIYVLHTLSSGGGTLVIGKLLLIRLDENKEYIYKRISQPKVNNIVEMKLIGYVYGGDRCIGNFANVQVIGNELKIKQHDGDTPIGDCEKVKVYSIDLTKLN